MERLIFSGHDTFTCKHSWLKKGYDFLNTGHSFTDADAVVKLGVGKNMVTAIRYWLRSFGLTDESDTLQEEAHLFLSTDEGYDPYIEDNATLYYLHYLLVKTNRASLYSIVFNELRKESFGFSRKHLQQFVVRKCEEVGAPLVNDNTLDTDITVFVRSYSASNRSKPDVEEDSTGLLQDLSLLSVDRTTERVDNKETSIEWYRLENQERNDIPWQVVLMIILDNPTWGEVISFRDLEAAPNSPGLVFALNEKGLYYKIEEMIERYPKDIVYSSTAGNRVLTIKKDRVQLAEVMQEYYGQTV
ncbi:Protein of unknown function [Hymenobacter daecheongensis DSM 21074]|uniref:DUF4007 domain-containing protein n=1 Tax=Hymenobacter daecheongensis DSM 21074 TaxID=1121955 RepID=A0A1M6B4H0_9BACT|nr:DUF4007 family protein [Hymenobacter daecheongensis]SHI43363.1 Protein of unknown function [Hymenobacter daecheongensis DSM 21074]